MGASGCGVERIHLPGMRDDGAGDLEGLAAQWISGSVVFDLLDELDEVRDGLSDSEMAHVTSVMCQTLHKATSRGKESASLALSRLISKIPELVDTAFLVIQKKPVIFLHWFHHVTGTCAEGYSWRAAASRPWRAVCKLWADIHMLRVFDMVFCKCQCCSTAGIRTTTRSRQGSGLRR